MTHFVEPMKPCKLLGAYATVSGIRNALPLLHSPCGCQYYLRACLLLHDGIDPVILTSDISQDNVIFGGEDKLRASILECYNAYKPNLIVVLGSCAPSLVGDDMEAVANGLKDQLQSDIIVVDSAGFAGDQTSGFRDVTLKLLEKYANDDVRVKKKVVNLIGFIPGYDYRWRQDIKSIINTLSLMGIEVNAVLGGYNSIEQMKEIGSAELNIVFSDIRGIEIANYLHQRFKTPFIRPKYLPIGMQCVSDWIDEVSHCLNIEIASKNMAKRAVDEAIKQFEYIDLGLVTTYTVDARATIVCEPYRAITLAKFLSKDIGMNISNICATESNTETENFLMHSLEEMGICDCKVTTQVDGFTVRKSIEEIKPGIVYGSTFERASAYNVGASLIRIGYPSYDETLITYRPYMGIDGIPVVMEDLCNAVIKREL
ncbi:MAG TPA: nitrogenase component 1 [Anaerolineales bacterium]|nr:nitrogenase component 1 [Anaerolineales bacterium]